MVAGVSSMISTPMWCWWCWCTSLCEWSEQLIEPDELALLELLDPTELRLWWPRDILRGIGSPEWADSLAEEDEVVVVIGGEEGEDGINPLLVVLVEELGLHGVTVAAEEEEVTRGDDPGEAEVPRIQGWARMSSILGLFSGGTRRHCLTRS